MGFHKLHLKGRETETESRGDFSLAHFVIFVNSQVLSSSFGRAGVLADDGSTPGDTSRLLRLSSCTKPKLGFCLTFCLAILSFKLSLFFVVQITFCCFCFVEMSVWR